MANFFEKKKKSYCIFLTIYITPFPLGKWFHDTRAFFVEFQFVCNYKDEHTLISKDAC